MFISLLYAHMRLYCVENLHYYTRECCHWSITGCPPARSHAVIKGGWEACNQKHQQSEAMACIWCSSSRPPEICIVLSSKRCYKRTCEWQEKSLLPHPATVLLLEDPFWTSCPCIFQWCRFSVDRVLLCHILGVACFWVPKNWHLW